MKGKRFRRNMLTAAILGTSLGLGSCGLYGPPPEKPITDAEMSLSSQSPFSDPSDKTSKLESSKKESSKQDTSPLESSYDPSKEKAYGVYGPPPEESSDDESHQLESETTQLESSEPVEISFDPSSNISESIYGPPPFLNSSNILIDENI